VQKGPLPQREKACAVFLPLDWNKVNLVPTADFWFGNGPFKFILWQGDFCVVFVTDKLIVQ